MGGDITTNGAAVGGMLGAHNGFNKLDKHLVKKLIECDVTTESNPGTIRPSFLSVGKHGIVNIQ
jgi:ADP-ribosylglycohydrolase